jgi:lysophospholipase L1-like esterase
MSRAPLRTAALALASLVIFLGAAEALCRAFDLRPALKHTGANPPWLGERWLLPRPDYREGLAEAGLLSRAYQLYRWDRHAVFGLRPDVELSLIDPLAPPELREHTRFTVRTNSRGYRTPEFADLPEPGRRRVVSLGDSSTFGWGVEQEETYPQCLEQALQRRWQGRQETIEVVNLGVPGYSTFQGRVLLEREALALAPDVITWSFLGNDGQQTGRSDAEIHLERMGWRGAVLAVLHRSAAYETLAAWIAAAGARAPTSRAGPQGRNVRSSADSLRSVRQAVGLAQQAQVPIVLVALCVRGAATRMLEGVARERGVPFLDGMTLLDTSLARARTEPGFASERERLRERYGEALLAESPELHLLLPDGCHPNALGQRLVGEALAEIVADLLEAKQPEPQATTTRRALP